MVKEKACWYVTNTSGANWYGGLRSENEAKERAEREAKTNPHDTFYVMRILGHVRVEQPAIWTDYE